jgi:hypothetical protein
MSIRSIQALAFTLAFVTSAGIGLGGNQCPVVNAGPDVGTYAPSLPWSVGLAGSAHDPDSGPDPDAKPQWSVVSGPGTVDFDRPHAPETLATFSAYGTYQLKLEYNDGECTISDTVTVRLSDFSPVGPVAPSVPDLDPASDTGVSNTDNITGDNTPTFDGTAEDGLTVTIYSDGIAVGSGIAVGGYYSVTTSPLADGVHIITATATDGFGVSAQSGGLAVTIDTTLPGNRCPTADAGPASMMATWTAPSCSVVLQGSASDPDSGPQPLTIAWSKVSGPGTVTFQNKADPKTIATFNAAGTYVLQLWCSDGACESTDTVTITITGTTSPTATTVQGTVKEAGTGTPIQNARLYLSNAATHTGSGALTDANGFYSFTGPGLESYTTLSVTALHNTGQTRAVSVNPSTTNTYDFTMTASSSSCGPLAYWNFEEGSGTLVHDLSGNHHDGRLMGNPQWVTGYEGHALQLDGKDDYVDTGITDNLAKWTICCWVSSPVVPAAAAPSGPMQRGQNFQINWNHTDARLRSAAALKVEATWYSAGLGPLAAHTWYHLAATYDGSSLKAYRNAQLISTTSCPGTPVAEGNSLKLGRNASAAQFFTGTLDETYVYPCALSEEEIKALMSKGLMSVREVIDNGTIDSQQACYASLWSGKGTLEDYTTDVLDLYDSGSRGHFDRDAPFGVVAKGLSTLGGVDNLSMRVDGILRIPSAQGGDWTFGVNSDDGFTLVFPGQDFSSATNGELAHLTEGTALRFAPGRAAGDTLGVINLAAGDHPFWLTYHQATLGAEFEFFGAKGRYTAFDPEAFHLVGQRDIGAVPMPGLCGMVTMIATRPGSWSGGAIDSLAKAKAVLAAGGVAGTNRSANYAFVNHSDPDAGGADQGLFPGDLAFPNDRAGLEDDDFAVKVTGQLDIPTSGIYQIGFNSDDGASLRIVGQVWESIVADGTGQALISGDELASDAITPSSFTVGQIALTAGCHAFEAVMFQHSGSSYFELLGRGVSDRGIPDPTWHLLRTGGSRSSVNVQGPMLVGPQ